MPQFMFKSPRGTGYVFRRAVPADVREIIGKREFKVSLGGDYRGASQRTRELAVSTDQQIAAARASGGTPECVATSAAVRTAVRSDPQLSVIDVVSPDLVARLHAAVVTQVLAADRQRRYRARVAISPPDGGRQNESIRNWAVLAKQGDEVAAQGWREMLSGTLERMGYRLAEELRGSQQEKQLLVEYSSAYLDALDGPRTPSPVPKQDADAWRTEPTASPAVLMLSAAVKEFLEHLPPSRRAMNEKHSFVLPAFLDVVGDMPVTDIRQAHVKDFLLTVQSLPPRWSELRRREMKGIRELANVAWDETLSRATYEGTYRASLRAFLDRAVVDWQDVGFPTTLTTNVPYLGARTKVERKQRAMQPDEIRLIFFSENMKKIVQNPSKVHKFWLLAIELYTGARVREICQLNPQSDWGQRDGVWWIRFTDEPGPSPDPAVVKSVKTGRPRTIPLHSELVRLGLPEYLDLLRKGGARRLFPQWSPTKGDAGAAPGKWVANYMRSIGLHGVENEQGNAVRGSHTFRHTLLTHGKLNGVNLRCISGHRETTDNPVADGYEDQTLLVTLADMSARLEKLSYGVELPVPVRATPHRIVSRLPGVETS